jgi:formylglycine-generating enzyme required for sulfatase activity
MLILALLVNEGRSAWTPWSLQRSLEWRPIPTPPDGKFLMGCVPNDHDCRSDELSSDARRGRDGVTLPGFELMSHEVTVDEFSRVAALRSQTIGGRYFARGVAMSDQPSWSGPDHPVVNVSWREATAFCRFVRGRFPTEAEWGYAARGKDGDRVYPWGNDDSQEQRNGDGVGGRDRWERSAPMKSFPAFDWGLYDMAGNVWEWTSSLYKKYPYKSDDGREDPHSGEARVVRGGSFDGNPGGLRVSYRNVYPPVIRDVDLGFRCARDVSP